MSTKNTPIVKNPQFYFARRSFLVAPFKKGGTGSLKKFPLLQRGCPQDGGFSTKNAPNFKRRFDKWVQSKNWGFSVPWLSNNCFYGCGGDVVGKNTLLGKVFQSGRGPRATHKARAT